MNDKMNDKVVKEKMQSLDTLSGGIVFGKEEAWEKLQARMEQKPARKIPVKYWLAAAAILLLFIGVTTVYYYASKEVANSNNEKMNDPVNNVAITQQQTVPIIQQTKMPMQKTIAPHEHSSKQTIPTPLKNKKTEHRKIKDAKQLNQRRADKSEWAY